MADVTRTNLDVVRPLGGVPFGNMTILPFELTVAAGVLANSDKATAVAATDVIYVGTIPKGFKFYDITAKAIAAVGAATSTIDVGFEYVDGVDVTALPEDADAFFDAQATSAAFFARGSLAKVPPIALTKDAYLTITVNTAAWEGTATLYITLIGICDQ